MPDSVGRKRGKPPGQAPFSAGSATSPRSMESWLVSKGSTVWRVLARVLSSRWITTVWYRSA